VDTTWAIEAAFAPTLPYDNPGIAKDVAA
jgi:hypothetical protein